MTQVEHYGSYQIIKPNSFNPHHIAASGQCFRWYKVSPTVYCIVHGNQVGVLEELPDDEGYLLRCSDWLYYEVWCDYFDLNTDYEQIKAMVDKDDSFLRSAVTYGDGIRILKQDPWECLITFIISQQNNIPRIQGIINRLCQSLGQRIDSAYGHFYSFPTPKQILNNPKALRGVGVGFRDKYILESAQQFLDKGGYFYMEKLRRFDAATTISELKGFYGVGDKVANCISLFGLDHKEAFPVDVWIKRIIEEHYQGDFDMHKYDPYSGVIQQYMFYYGRMIK